MTQATTDRTSIATKLSRISSALKAAGWTEKQGRHLIHGTGGSPRRARRLLKDNIELAVALRDAYAKGIADGVPHSKLMPLCNELYRREMARIAPADDADSDDAGSDAPADDTDVEPEEMSTDELARELAPLAASTQAPDLTDLFGR